MSPIVTADRTEVGNYFIATYPPFSVWTPEAVNREARPALDREPGDVPLGLYLHIPFCRKRCHFCYFRVYTDKNAADVAGYLDALAREWELYNEHRAIAGRPLNFVYFGGGTPSYLSVRQLETLVRRLDAVSSWRSAEEITFECEPGTLTEAKLSAIRALGITRLSLGVENFDDEILERNGRAHRSPEIDRAFAFARSLGFPQINIDLIAGMLGETDENWTACVRKTVDLAPDSVTIYQMELPFNTTISRNLLTGRQDPQRRWVGEAFEALEAAGYTIGSAYTAVRNRSATFLYRDRLWQGADMVGLGVSSFGHINGVHMQNADKDEPYRAGIEAGALPLARALRPTPEQRLIREFVLQLKLGAIRPGYFVAKYQVDVLDRFREPLASLVDDGYASVGRDRVTLTREGLLRVDSLLPRFFEPEFVHARYA
jgi:oxygen-independent coproporphyrinogen-3 oxidase